MSISKLIIEAISLTQHAPRFEEKLNKIFDKHLGDLQTLHDAAYNISKMTDPTIADLANEYVALIDYDLVFTLKPELLSMGKSVGKQSLTAVDIIPMPDRVGGSADITSISINHKFIKHIIDFFIILIKKHVPNSMFSEPATKENVNKFFMLIKDHVLPNLLGGVLVTSVAHHIANAFLHELVHIEQNARQTAIGRTNMAYKSYAGSKKPNPDDDDNEITQLNKSGNVNSPRFDKLYFASPQEMAAFTHNIVNKIVNHYEIYADKDNVPMSTAASEIPGQVKYYLTPTTKTEQNIFNRYVKLAYQELSRYYASLTPNKS